MPRLAVPDRRRSPSRTGREGSSSTGRPGVNERFVIVGAGLTGGTAAVTLRQEGFDGPLTIIGSERHLPYERPPLSKTFLRGETPFEDALVQPGSFYRDKGIELRLGVTATAIDPAAMTVSLDDGEPISYDRLLLA